MSDRLRWILILGCAVVAVLHAPTAASLIAESWSGPYAQPGARGVHDPSTAFVPTETLDAVQTVAAQSDESLAATQLERDAATWRRGVVQGL